MSDISMLTFDKAHINVFTDAIMSRADVTSIRNITSTSALYIMPLNSTAFSFLLIFVCCLTPKSSLVK